MVLTEKFLILSELARKWNKTDVELIRWISSGDMEAWFGYQGHIKSPFGRELEYAGWAKADAKDIALLLSLDEVVLKHFYVNNNSNKPIKVTPLKKQLLYGRIEEFISDLNFKITIDSLVVVPLEVIRMELERPDLTTDFREKPLKTLKVIAKHFGVSVTTLKKLMKHNNFPHHKPTGQIEAYPSEISAWLKNRKKKDEVKKN